MTKTRLLCACAASVMAFAAASPAMAQTAPDDSVDTSRDIVITGSIIKGTPEDAALPVDVIGEGELQRQGNPSALDLVKALPTSSASLGDSNQFDSRSQGAEGIATINLRGLSPQRTLVLLNSKRLTTAGNGVPSVDINLLPTAAIGRVEILKDGAAATYGSEAIAGVVNFITRTDQEGFQVSGNYRFIQDTDGDIDASISYGHQGNGLRFLVAAGFQKRGQLLAKDRDFAIKPYPTNPQGGWTGGGNPANFLFLGAAGAPASGVVADNSCASLGGYVGADARCYNQYSVYDALVELEKRFQGFADVEIDLGGSTKFEVTALYGRTTVPHYLTSPSYLLTQPPSPASGAISQSGFFAPSTNPGLIAYRAANPGTPAGIGVLFPTLLFRPYLLGGNPSTLGDKEEPGSARGMRKSESFRATAELRGDLGSGLSYNLNVTYHDYYRYIDGFDSFGDRVQRALLGLGGPNCTGTTPGANGCLWFNPFGNSVARNTATGAVNSQNNGPANSQELTDWFFVKGYTAVDTELVVGEASLSGDTGLKLPGGNIQFGVGGQYRHTNITTRYGNNNNIAVNPCRDTPITGNTNPAACSGGSAPTGANAFLGTKRQFRAEGRRLGGLRRIAIADHRQPQRTARRAVRGLWRGDRFDLQPASSCALADYRLARDPRWVRHHVPRADAGQRD